MDRWDRDKTQTAFPERLEPAEMAVHFDQSECFSARTILDRRPRNVPICHRKAILKIGYDRNRELNGLHLHNLETLPPLAQRLLSHCMPVKGQILTARPVSGVT